MKGLKQLSRKRREGERRPGGKRLERGFQSWCQCVPALALRTGRALPQPSTGQLWPCRELGSCPRLQDLVLTDSGPGSLQPSLGSSGNHCSPCQLCGGTATARLPGGATGAAHCPIPGAVWAAPPAVLCPVFPFLPFPCPEAACFLQPLLGPTAVPRLGILQGPPWRARVMQGARALGGVTVTTSERCSAARPGRVPVARLPLVVGCVSGGRGGTSDCDIESDGEGLVIREHCSSQEKK